MILIGLGSNIDGPWGNPKETIEKALKALDQTPCALKKHSSLIVTKPFGVIDQPDFVNAAALIETKLAPLELMAHLHAIENQASRKRIQRWGPRTLDLDLLDYNGEIITEKSSENIAIADGRIPLNLPHAGIAERVFVLEPLAEIAPEWKHPVLKATARELMVKLS